MNNKNWLAKKQLINYFCYAKQNLTKAVRFYSICSVSLSSSLYSIIPSIAPLKSPAM